MKSVIVDGVTYRSTEAMIKALGLNVKNDTFYRYFTKNKNTFTLEEIKKAEQWIINNIKQKEEYSVNLGNVLYNLLYTAFTPRNTFLDTFMLALPTADNTEAYFLDYINTNYPKIQSLLPSYVDLDILIKTIKDYKAGKTQFEYANTTGRKTTTSVKIAGKTFRQCSLEYNVPYNSVWYLYYNIKDLPDFSESMFFTKLEEKREQLLQRKRKKQK